MNFLTKCLAHLLPGAAFVLGVTGCAAANSNAPAWPEVTIQAKPHVYWWWMGSAVDTNNLTRELERYHAAGLGGVHIIPIYGAKGWESRYIPYLSPRWMEMLNFTVTEAKRLGMEVDMTTGTGWCFGGPQVTDEEANAVMVSRQWSLLAGENLPDKVDRATTQALMAFGPDGKKEDLLGRISADGSVNWTAPEGDWIVYAISQKPSGQKVKRAAPGGEGWMLNLAYPQAMTDYLRWMETGFADYKGAKPRAQYHDSYEYKMDWSPVLFAEFERRRGYRLQDYLDVFLTGEPADQAARVKCDYRETLSDIMVEETVPQWVNWSHTNGFITRNEAHGSPGNWLDLYADADIPETEMFHLDRNILISKFASSAAHVTGKPLVSAETGTWLTEHFTETLADMKYLLDDMFLAGVNHVFYHGTCYSPDEVPWPGWVFYASYEMNPRNAIWHDVPALNAYATRCQSVLQAGHPDNDILIYWPLHDFWSNPEGMVRNLTVHARDWFEDQPMGKTAEKLWKAGYQFDYVSDRQLACAKATPRGVSLGGDIYKVIVIPACDTMPLETFTQLVQLASHSPVTVVFVDKLPADVPGLGRLKQQQRPELLSLRTSLTEKIAPNADHFAGFGEGNGKVFVGPLEAALRQTQAAAKLKLGPPGLLAIRRALPDGRYYFIANRGNKTVDGWIPLGARAESVAILDPMTGQIGVAASRQSVSNQTEVRLNLPAGASVILRAFNSRKLTGPVYPEFKSAGRSLTLKGQWQVKFLSGGPTLPPSFTTGRLASWTKLGDTNAQSFAGTAAYTLRFDAPAAPEALEEQAWQLDLGKVCQSARVKLNGVDYGTLFTPPFRVVVDHLKAKDNVLEVEVTNTSANRIRDLDRRGVQWQNFHDINFVNLNYHKFDASNWSLADSGLLGPVRLTPLEALGPGRVGD